MKGQHAQRMIRLGRDYGVPDNRTCLLYNSNSSMGDTEASEWTYGPKYNAATNTDASGIPTVDNEKINIFSAIDAAIASVRVANTPYAVALSADPFFTSRRADIVLYFQLLQTKSENANLVACYPFSEYYLLRRDAGATTLSRTMSYGPSLQKLYQGIGTKAGDFLTTPTRLTITDATSMYQYNPAA
jgi:hypothetical protein